MGNDAEAVNNGIERIEELATEMLRRANELEESLKAYPAHDAPVTQEAQSMVPDEAPPSDAYIDQKARRYQVKRRAEDGTWRMDPALITGALNLARQNREPQIAQAAERLAAQQRDDVLKSYGMTPKEPPAKWLYMTEPPTAAPRPNTAQPMGAALRYARTGSLDVQALSNKVVDAFGRLSRDEPLTSLEAALVTLLYPKDFDFMDESAARMIALISDDEKEQVRERVVARVNELAARNYASHVPGQHVTLASR